MFETGRSSIRFFAVCIFLVASVRSVWAATVDLRGSVRDENEVPVAAASIAVVPAPPSSGSPWRTQTDPSGSFDLTLPAPGGYLVTVERQGFYQLKDRPVQIDRSLELMLTISPVREVFQSVDVNEQPSPVDIEQVQKEERLTGTEINSIPYANSHSLRNSMKLMPGVLEGASGELHFNGASENQVQYLLNGFNISDPITGQFRSTLAVEGIRSTDYSAGRYSPEYGQGSAGVLAINTESGTDSFHYTSTDFIPGLQAQQGIRLGNWYPRFGVSGPIVRGRAWFSDTFTYFYTTALITGLPRGQNTRSGWAGSNLLHIQVNLSPRNILFANFLVNVNNATRVGLGPLDPASTTQSMHTQLYFGSLKEQVYLSDRSMIEFGYGYSETGNDSSPQGQNLYQFSPEGRRGNYFVNGTQGARRDEGRIHGYAPWFHLAGTHQLEAGVDADFLHENADFQRTGYQLIGLAGQVLSQTSFVGPGTFDVHDVSTGAWLQDTWKIAKRLQIVAGARSDTDQLVHDAGWSPRVAFSWSPFAKGKTRVAGGYAITRDVTPLSPFGRAYDQTAVTTEYSNGIPTGDPLLTRFVPGGTLRLPEAKNWSFNVDHEISARLSASVAYLRRRGTDELSFVNTIDPEAPPSILPLPNGSNPGIYQLSSVRRDDYDSVQFSVRQRFSGQFEWMASYTWSRAQSNAILDPNSLVPLQVLPSLIPMPWNSPNRFLGWAYAPLPWKNWAITALVDARSGFPFSIQDQYGTIVGEVNSYRYPVNFDLNLAIERMITLRGYRFALRGGIDNITNQNNPTAVYNIVGSPQYGQFLGYEGRHFVARVRLFGRAAAK